MSPNMNKTDQRRSQRMDVDREELGERIARALPRNGVGGQQRGMYLSRFTTTTDLGHGFLSRASA
jgi:hypothetical protein